MDEELHREINEQQLDLMRRIAEYEAYCRRRGVLELPNIRLPPREQMAERRRRIEEEQPADVGTIPQEPPPDRQARDEQLQAMVKRSKGKAKER
jgi:hypothetical protein